jgi:hypothetical protein
MAWQEQSGCSTDRPLSSYISLQLVVAIVGCVFHQVQEDASKSLSSVDQSGVVGRSNLSPQPISNSSLIQLVGSDPILDSSAVFPRLNLDVLGVTSARDPVRSLSKASIEGLSYINMTNML